MRFVDDQGIGERKQLREPVLLERHVGEQQVVVDHHHVRLRGAAAGLDHVASVECRTLRPEAVVRRGGDRAPDRIVLREVLHLREIAAGRPGRPSRKPGRPRGHAGRGEPPRGQHLFVAPAAEVVRAALEQREARVAFESAADQRQIAAEQLLLEMAGAGGDHDPAAAGDGGNEVREGLAGPGPRLADEDVALRHGPLDRRGHGPLIGPGRVPGQQPRQRAGRGEDAVAGRVVHRPGARLRTIADRRPAGGRTTRSFEQGPPLRATIDTITNASLPPGRRKCTPRGVTGISTKQPSGGVVAPIDRRGRRAEPGRRAGAGGGGASTKHRPPASVTTAGRWFGEPDRRR